MSEDLASIDRAIEALESQRGTLGDAVVDTALEPLRERRHRLLVEQGSEQRKLVTILFADVVDFTVLSRRLDAEDTRAVVGAYFTRWQEVIDAHGGTVEKFIGDAVMAVFGLYRSTEEDAERAVRAGLAMIDALPALNEELEKQYGVSVQMRVGVDTGDVVVSTLEERAGHEFVAVGPTVNRASRLQSVAPPGRVLVSADTHRQVRGRFNVESSPGLRLKGIDEPVDAYLVISERPRGFSLDRTRGVEGVETSTVGRDAQLRFLQERLEDVMDESRWCVVTMLGEAGLGKSRLLLDFDSWLEQRPELFYWFRGRAASADRNRPYALLRDLLAGRFGIQDTDAPEVVREKVQAGFSAALSPEEAASTARTVAVWLGFDSPTPDDRLPSDPQSLSNQASTALASYVAQLSQAHPVVMLLEDLHWADDGSLRWLDAADALLHDHPVLVVATARPALVESRPLWGEGLAQHVRLPLTSLSRRESRKLLQQILHKVPELPSSLVDLVVDAAEGNPYYIEELVTWLIDAGVIVKSDDVWRVEGTLVDTVVVPSTLRGVLQARLDSLGADERDVVQRASVVGRVFWDEAVARLEERREPEQVDAVLDVLRGREVIFERDVSAFGSAREFLFKHALLRDVAYEAVLRTHRERYHRMVAQWLTEVSQRTGRDREYATLIAHHYDRARDPQAGSWYLQAGRQAAEVFALEEAGRLLQRGLEIVDDSDPELRFDLLATREDVLERVGDREAQQQLLTELEELCAQLPDDAGRRVRVLLGRARLAFELSEYADALQSASEAEATARAADLLDRVAEAELWRGKALTWDERLPEAERSLNAARELASTLHRPWLQGESLRYLAMAANDGGDYPRALELVSRSRSAFAEEGDTEAEATATAMQATTLFNMGRTEESLRMFEEVLEVFRRSGHRYRQAIMLGNLGSVAYSHGRLADAARYSAEAAEITKSMADLEATATNLTVLADVEILTRSWESAHARLVEALRMARASSSVRLEADALARMAELALEEGDGAGALGSARQAAETATTAPSPLSRGYCHVVLGYAEIEHGDVAAAGSAFTEAAETLAALGRDAMSREAEVGLAAVSLRRGEAAAAAERARVVVGHVDAAGMEDAIRPGAMLLNAWRALDAVGDADATQVLREARAFLLDRAEAIGDADLARGYLGKSSVSELLRLAEERGSA